LFIDFILFTGKENERKEKYRYYIFHDFRLSVNVFTTKITPTTWNSLFHSNLKISGESGMSSYRFFFMKGGVFSEEIIQNLYVNLNKTAAMLIIVEKSIPLTKFGRS
jgi:hypothetical protein